MQSFFKINHRVTKMVRELRHLPYVQRMESLNMLDFKRRGIQADLLMVYRILSDTKHPLRYLLTVKETRTTRAHAKSLVVPQSRLNCRRHFFSVRVCFMWNSLPEHIVFSDNEATFKRRLQDYLLHSTYVGLSSWNLKKKSTAWVCNMYMLHALFIITIVHLVLRKPTSHGYCKA